MYKSIMLMFCLLSPVIISTVQAGEKSPTGPYFGAKPSPTPALLAPELLRSHMVEFNGTFSADGSEFYFTLDIPGKKRQLKGIIAFTRMLDDGSWQPPAVAEFSGTHSDYDPIFSADDNRLYFSSRRPLPT